MRVDGNRIGTDWCRPPQASHSCLLSRPFSGIAPLVWTQSSGQSAGRSSGRYTGGEGDLRDRRSIVIFSRPAVSQWEPVGAGPRADTDVVVVGSG